CPPARTAGVNRSSRDHPVRDGGARLPGRTRWLLPHADCGLCRALGRRPHLAAALADRTARRYGLASRRARRAGRGSGRARPRRRPASEGCGRAGVFQDGNRMTLRALVTRPEEDAAPLAAALAERGIDVTLEPLLSIHPLPDAPIDLTGVQALLFTSANGVRSFAELAGARNPAGRRELPALAGGHPTPAPAPSPGVSQPRT